MCPDINDLFRTVQLSSEIHALIEYFSSGAFGKTTGLGTSHVPTIVWNTSPDAGVAITPVQLLLTTSICLIPIGSVFPGRGS